MTTVLAAIDHFIRKGAVLAPDNVRRGVFIRAALEEGIFPDWLEHCICEQSFRPDFDRLVKAGLTAARLAEGRFAIAICQLTGDRRHDLANVSRCYALLEPDGSLLVAGRKKAGAASIEAKVDRHLELEGAESKHHCRIFWARRTEGTPPQEFAEWHAAGAIQRSPMNGFFTAPGIFGSDKIDVGSQLLAGHFDGRISGRVADMGSGWGYLSFKLIERSPDIRQLDLYEAEFLAIEAASATLGEWPELTCKINQHWSDVVAGLPTGGYDWIVTNPPFHHGRRADPAIGQAFILNAASALAKDGRLLMVANNHLPYEATLTTAFDAWELREAAAGFKVIEAIGPLPR